MTKPEFTDILDNDSVLFVESVNKDVFIGITSDDYYSFFVKLDDKRCVCTRTGLYKTRNHINYDKKFLTFDTISIRDTNDDDNAKPTKAFVVPTQTDNDIFCLLINELLRHNKSTLYISVED